MLIGLLVPIAWIDLRRRIIPNRLTGPGSLAALALGLAIDPAGVPAQLLAGAAAGGFLLLAALVRPDGMGMGDVKLAAMLGLFLKGDVAVALLVALLAAALLGLALAARHGARRARAAAIPFGPFLALGALVALLAGGTLRGWYLG